MDAMEDISAKIFLTGQGLEKEEKEAARKAAILGGWCGSSNPRANIDSFIENNGNENGYAVGVDMIVADLMIYAGSSNLVSGLFDGVPDTALDEFKNIHKCQRL